MLVSIYCRRLSKAPSTIGIIRNCYERFMGLDAIKLAIFSLYIYIYIAELISNSPLLFPDKSVPSTRVCKRDILTLQTWTTSTHL